MVDTGRIACARFTLVSFTLDFIDALLRHDRAAAECALDVTIPDLDWAESDADKRFLHFRRDDLVRDPAASPWLARAIVLPETTMAGHIGFHGPPDSEGIAEMGYTVFAPYRRQGFAFEAIGAIMAWARGRGVQRFRLSIAPDNEPSLALAAKLGFEHVGVHIDEFDGREILLERDAT